MASKIITGNRHSTVYLNNSNSSWTVAKNASVSVNDGQAIYEDGARSNNTFINNGKLFADNGNHTITAQFDGSRTDVTNGATGVVTGQTGFRLGGDRQTMHNEGRIDVSEKAISIYGQKTVVTNDGKIISDNMGIDFINSDGAQFINAHGGKINTGETGVSFDTDAGVSARFTNLGSLVSQNYAVYGSMGNDTVINRGVMTGNISFGDGNDRFDTIGGTYTGFVAGGAGNDTLLVDKASIQLIESGDEGIDTVRSTVSYALNHNVERLFLLGKANISGTGNYTDNELHGNSGNNTLKGMDGNDDLFGGKGNDKLIGGLGSDIFHFATGDGKDTIVDFTDGLDRIDLSQWAAITSFSDLKAHHLERSGSDMVLSAGDDSLTLKNVTKAELDAMDFIF